MSSGVRNRLALLLVLVFGLSGVAAFAQGRGGIPRVIGWASTAGNAGVTWGAVADITPTQAGITYDAASLIINVPTGKTVHFKTNGTGGATFDNNFIIDGATADEVQLLVQAAVAQDTAAVFTVENSAGTDQFWVTYLGGVTLTSSLSFSDANVTIAETGTNDLQIRTDNAASLVISGGTTTVLAFQGTTFTIADAAGNAGPVFTDAGTTINVAFDGIVTLAGGNLLIDGTTDQVQLTVQGHSTQTTLPFVVENSAGTDLFTVSNTGDVRPGSAIIMSGGNPIQFTDGNVYLVETGTNILTLAGAGGVLIDGIGDAVQLTVQGNATQTTLPFVVENSAGTDQFTVSNAGDVVALGTGTWTGDMTLNGGTGALGFGAGETITAADGSLTIGGGSGLDMTGGVTAVYYRLNDVNVSISETGTNDLALTADGAVAGTFSSAGLSLTQVTATSADGGSSAGIRASSAVAGIGWQETDAAADNKVWDILANGTKLTHRAVNDANTIGTTWLEVARTGTTVDSVTFPTDVTFNGGAGAITLGAGETIVLGDSNLNITGGVEVTTTLRVASGNGIISGGAGIGVSIDAAGVSANPTTLGGQVAIAHLSGGGGLATGAVAGTGCGTASAPTQSGNDIGGSLGATCGTAGTTTNPIITVTFADAYSTAPFCTIAAENAATAALMVSAQIVPVTTTTTLAVNCGGGTCPTGTLAWRYTCIQ